MKVLVTGGSGYLGSILVPDLLSAGHSVTVIDNFMYGQNSLAQCCSDPKFNVINSDVRIQKIVNEEAKKSDVIIPLAALVGAPICNRDPVGATTTNRDAVISMLEGLSKNQRVLMPTTNSAYGTGDKNNFCDETTPLKPISLYAVDKVEVEKALLNRENSISFRLATVFGMSPRMRVDLLVNDSTHRAVFDKFVVLFEAHFKRNYIHIRDIARVFLHGIDKFDGMKSEAYNVGLSDANLSKLELCNAIRKYIPEFVILEAPVGKDPDQRNYIVSNAKIEKTGFKPKYSLDDGIVEMIKGYKMIKNVKYGNA